MEDQGTAGGAAAVVGMWGGRQRPPPVRRSGMMRTISEGDASEIEGGQQRPSFYLGPQEHSMDSAFHDDGHGYGNSGGVSSRTQARTQARSRSESDMGELWENRAYEHCERDLGPDKYKQRFTKVTQKVRGPKFGDKTRLSMKSSKAKKLVTTSQSYIRRCNAVGAVGYAHVTRDVRIPENNFFWPGRRFRIRLRHSNLRCDDDAAASVREVAMKFADQNEDGPLDLILFTGRTAPARNCDSLMKLMKLRTPDDVKQMCHKDPQFFFSLVDGLRRAPASFSNLVYYSQIPYRLIPKDGKLRLVKFRLTPSGNVADTGLLDDEDQQHPWESARRTQDNRVPHYLRAEFLRRIEDEPIDYVLQIQINGEADPEHWNPQKIWDEEQFPWFDLANIKLTTALTCAALHRTYFNIVDKPTCLSFPAAISPFDYKSYQHVCCEMYTKFEIKHLGPQQLQAGGKDGLGPATCEHPKVIHIVTVAAGPVKETRPNVDVFITLTGTYGRSTPRRLDHRHDGDGYEHTRDIEHFEVQTEPVGDLLAVTIAVRHRHLTDDWYLRYVILNSPDGGPAKHFPCHSVVLSKVSLRAGTVSLPQNDCHEVLRQERLLELRDRQHDYVFQAVPGMPSQIRAHEPQDVPANEQLRAEKFLTVPWEVDHALGDFLASLTAVRSATPQTMTLTPRQHSYDSSNGRRTSMGRRAAFNRQTSAPAVRQALERKSNPRARMRWQKLKLALNFIAKVKLPDGVKGEMCRAIQDDLDFGRAFHNGNNPTILQRCTVIPDNLPVNEELVNNLLDRDRTLTQEAQDGHIYLVDYKIFEDIPTYHQDADHRYLAAPLCLFYLRSTGDLSPLAIQLSQTPSPDSPIFTPKDIPEDWLMAKLWVRCADFHHQFLINHLLKTHLIVEPFAIATLRQLSVVHPVYKLLKPHFRYTIPMNVLLRKNIMRKGGALDKWLSVGHQGALILMKKYFETFSFEELDLPADLVRRGVDNPEKLVNHHYREDGTRLWAAVAKYCRDTLCLFYKKDEDVANDHEIHEWITDIHDNGFPSLKNTQRTGLPSKLETIDDLVGLATKVIFTSTCFHNATHSEALDLYGFLPLVPAMMRQPPPNRKRMVHKDFIIKTLPDQSPEAYYGSLANVLQQCKPDENPLGNNLEMYFVEKEALAVQQAFRTELTRLTRIISQRTSAANVPSYDCLAPHSIPNSVEPVPFLPRSVTDDVSSVAHIDKANMPASFAMNPSVPLMTLPLCMSFARNMGGKSFIGRRMSVNMFSKAVGGMSVDRVNVPMQAIDRKKFSMNRYSYNKSQMNMMNNMYDGMY